MPKSNLDLLSVAQDHLRNMFTIVKENCCSLIGVFAYGTVLLLMTLEDVSVENNSMLHKQQSAGR